MYLLAIAHPSFSSISVAPTRRITASSFGSEAEPSRRSEHRAGAVAVLDVGRKDDDMQQQTKGIDRDVAGGARQLVARVEGMGVDRRPPFGVAPAIAELHHLLGRNRFQHRCPADYGQVMSLRAPQTSLRARGVNPRADRRVLNNHRIT